MIYFVTGATGFIGKRLVKSLLARPGSIVHFLIRDAAPDRLAALREYWGVGEDRAVAVPGDITRPDLGVEKSLIDGLSGTVDHLFHLAALYDLAADPEDDRLANVEGTRQVVAFAGRIGAGRLHHVSSIAAAGLYDGVFREDMFAEAEELDHPYFASKHAAEEIVRTECRIPWRIFRPGLVVGDSKTGETDKADGPYVVFKLIQKMRALLPPWMPTIGLEGGRINIVPVDFVVAALDHLAHLDGLDGRCFHLTDPHPHRVGEALNIFAGAAHAPAMTMRVNAALLGFIPRGLLRGLKSLTPVRRIEAALMRDLGLPEGFMQFVNYPTRFDSREAEKLLKPAGIIVPPLESYAWRLWDYWERHLDPDLFIDRSLAGRVGGKTVLITGGSAGIGKAAALRLAEAGAVTLIVARDPEKLDAVVAEAAAKGLRLIPYAADISEMAQCDALIEKVLAEHGCIDILVNNAGRSIRRGIEDSYDRFHDFERTMKINYFGALRLTLGFLPHMSARRSGQVINISSIGVLTNAPRFSAYVSSKAALEAWTRCAASEYMDRGIEFTTINMPLVRTEMVAPTRLYDHVPMLSPEDAADLIVEAVVNRPERIATRLGIFGQLVHALAPRMAHVIMNTIFRMFPDSAAAKGQNPTGEKPSGDQMALMQLMKGLYF